MILVKFMLLMAIFVASTLLGIKISKKYSSRVKELKEFQSALNIFEEKIKVAWEKAIDESNTKLTNDDKEVIKGLAKMLGKTDLDGQVNEIRLTLKFLETKLKEAEVEKSKNEKMYKTLGATIGLAIVIILV